MTHITNVLLFFIFTLILPFSLIAKQNIYKTTPDWSRDAKITPGENRANIYNVDTETLEILKTNGYIHAMKWPVTVTGLLIPYRPIHNYYENNTLNPLTTLLAQWDTQFNKINAETELYKWMGLSKVNGPDAQGIYKMPYPNGHPDQFYAGAGTINTTNGEGLTFSCFACHTTSLFGTTVMGLTNKRPRANRFFKLGQLVMPHLSSELYRETTHADENEVRMIERTKKNIGAVGGVVPQVLGLDTSLAHVTLSLAKRNQDDYATKNTFFEKNPRPNPLSHFVADSKPMPWWNLKYKTRWLSDGSVVSGNPIFTNYLWNEIGRGTDLKELETWMKENKNTIEEMTAAVFATEPPRYTDFFPEDSINLTKAQQGEQLFKQTCSQCHGNYEKAWSQKDSFQLSLTNQIKTTKVIYHEKTPVKDVGTDPQRYQATQYFAESFNRLAISHWMETVIEPQVGYVPPPLVGIWARYPYFHNGSIPNLCALLSQESDRPTFFIMGPAENKTTDFDQECNGYPVGEKIPKKWLTDFDAFMDTRKPGLRNTGHTKMLLNEKGEEKFSREKKLQLIEFLKTL